MRALNLRARFASSRCFPFVSLYKGIPVSLVKIIVITVVVILSLLLFGRFLF